MEAASLRLQKEAKGYLDSLRGKLVIAKCGPALLLTTLRSHDCVTNADSRND